MSTPLTLTSGKLPLSPEGGIFLLKSLRKQLLLFFSLGKWKKNRRLHRIS